MQIRLTVQHTITEPVQLGGKDTVGDIVNEMIRGFVATARDNGDEEALVAKVEVTGVDELDLETLWAMVK